MSEPASRPYTVDDLVAMPDDGRRRELIDGMLLVTPAPGWAHQEMGLTLYRTVAIARGEQGITAVRPFPVTVCPARLLDGLRSRD